MTRILLAASAAIALIAACSGEPEEAADPRATQADPDEISERAADDAAPASRTQGPPLLRDPSVPAPGGKRRQTSPR